MARASQRLARYAVQPIADEAAIRAFLLCDADYAAYALGDLEPPYARHASWFAAQRGGSIEGLALVYGALEPPVLFLMGSQAALAALLGSSLLPRRVLVLARPEDEPTLHRCCRVEYLAQMLRMQVTQATFRPSSGDARHTLPQHLNLSHAPAMQALLRRAASHDARDLSDIAFEPGMVTDGVYYGIFEGGDLLAMAGTHLVAPTAGLAAVGNVVVRPDRRGRGLGGLVSSAVTQSLFEAGIERVLLNVRQDNAPAIRVYARLGYEPVCQFVEGLAERP